MTTVDKNTINQQLAVLDTNISEIKNHIAECQKKTRELARTQALVIRNAIMDGDMLRGVVWKLQSNLTEMHSSDDKLSFAYGMFKRFRHVAELCDGIKIYSSSGVPNRIEIYASSYKTADLMAFANKYGLTVDHSAIDTKIAEMRQMRQMIAKPEESK